MASNNIIINPAITGSIPTINFTNTNSNTGNIDLTTTGTLEVCSGASAGNLSLKTNNTDRVYILNNGNVGINNTNPACKLDIIGPGVSSSTTLKVINNTTTSGSAIQTILSLFDSNTTINSQIQLAIGTGSSTTTNIFGYSYSNNSTGFGFLGLAGAGGTQICFDTGGFSIGTFAKPANSGTYKLEVTGATSIIGTLTTNNNTIDAGTGTINAQRINIGTGAVYTTGGIYYYDPTNAYYNSILTQHAGGGVYNLYFDSGPLTNGGFTFRTGINGQFAFLLNGDGIFNISSTKAFFKKNVEISYTSGDTVNLIGLYNTSTNSNILTGSQINIGQSAANACCNVIGYLNGTGGPGNVVGSSSSWGYMGLFGGSAQLTYTNNSFYIGGFKVPPNAGTNNLLQVDGNVYINGNLSLSSDSIILGNSALTGGTNAIAIGSQAGSNTSTVAIGYKAGNNNMGNQSIAIGYQAGLNNQSGGGLVIGYQSATTTQGAYTVAIGYTCAQTNQSQYAVAIGYQAGNYNEGSYAIAIGANAGNTSQGSYAIAIGNSAGGTSQGTNSIAIGYYAGRTNQHGNTIIINATGLDLSSNAANATYIAPLRNGANVGSSTTTYLMLYNPNSKEVGYSSASSGNTAKTFVIPHPITSAKYLVHACLEGPESGVYYRGKAEITNNENTTVQLPHYVDALATDFTVQITPIYNGTEIQTYNVSEVENNQFTVYGKNGKFYWLVQGKRADIEVEPDVSNTQVHGDGPYRWI